MLAVVRDAYGSSEVLKIEQVDCPEPQGDQVRLRVHSSSVNMGDRLMLSGRPYVLRLMMGLFSPRSRGVGQDVAGVVEAVGPDVRAFKVGDRVFGEVGFGATWAEQALVAEGALAMAPASASLHEVGALPIAALTALHAVRDQGRVRAGQRVLIHGASGSVGSYLIQMAHAAGAHVVAVCGPRHLELAASLGADEVLDYTREDFTALPEPFDVVLDVVGTKSLSTYLGLLTPGGVYVPIGSPVEDPWFTPVLRPLALWIRGWFSSKRIAVFVSTPSREDLEAVAKMVDRGEIQPTFGSTCALSELPVALAELERGERRGKVVLQN